VIKRAMSRCAAKLNAPSEGTPCEASAGLIKRSVLEAAPIQPFLLVHKSGSGERRKFTGSETALIRIREIRWSFLVLN
jgi:hypothetical protein